MNLLSRREFREHWEKLTASKVDDDSPLWIPEQCTGKKSRWFVSIKPFKFNRLEYHQWRVKHCSGQILCYSSGLIEEWWGFSHKADIALWILKWS